MTILVAGGWVQWDWQIGTFRAEIDGVVTGKFTDDITTAQELADRLAPDITLTQDVITELEIEKATNAADITLTQDVITELEIEKATNAADIIQGEV